MLTIKHVEDTGKETILQVKNVWTIPNGPQAGIPSSVCFEYEDGSANSSFNDGMVFVMNDKGQTVATYRGINGTGSCMESPKSVQSV